MDARMRKMAGWAVVAVGVIIALIGGLADQIGLGGEGPDEFGSRQVIAVVVGLVVAAVGLVAVLWPSAPKDASSTGPTES